MLHRAILVAIGANLAGLDGRSARDTCEWAVERLARLPGLSLQARSHWYRSVAVPPSGQPDYINGAARLWGRGTAAGVLTTLLEIEAAGGRQRGAANAARTLDLDLLAMDSLVLDAPGVPAVIVPHPRLHERGFVLAPLAEIAPDWVHPVLLRSAREMLAAVDQSGVERLAWK